MTFDKLPNISRFISSTVKGGENNPDTQRDVKSQVDRFSTEPVGVGYMLATIIIVVVVIITVVFLHTPFSISGEAF